MAVVPQLCVAAFRQDPPNLIRRERIKALEKAGKLVIVHDPATNGQGWFANGVMTLNAAFIRPGTELGVLLHEGGTHAEREAGARGILGDKAFDSLTATLDQWENGKDTVARDIAREATRRAANDRAQRKAGGETNAAKLDRIEAEERLGVESTADCTDRGRGG